MTTGIVALIIGIMVAAAGIYCLVKEAGDEESRKIYMIVTAFGVIVLAGAIVKLFML